MLEYEMRLAIHFLEQNLEMIVWETPVKRREMQVHTKVSETSPSQEKIEGLEWAVRVL